MILEKDSVLAAAKQVYDNTTLGSEAGDKYIWRENACEDFETLLNKSLRLDAITFNVTSKFLKRSWATSTSSVLQIRSS